MKRELINLIRLCLLTFSLTAIAPAQQRSAVEKSYMHDIPEAGLAVAGEDTADLAGKVRQFNLQVEQIIPVHARMGTPDDLRQAVSLRTARDQ